MAGKEMVDVAIGEWQPEHPGYSEDALRYGVEVELPSATQAKYGKDPVYEGFLARFPLAIREVTRVSVFGSKKHEKPLTDNSFIDVPDAYSVYTNGVSRHILGEAVEGPINYEDGELLHAAQLAWNALARLEVYLRGLKKGEGSIDRRMGYYGSFHNPKEK